MHLALWIILVATATTVAGATFTPVTATKCPQDVETETRECFTSYRQRENSMATWGQNYYSGVDPESIRAICSAMWSGAHCAHALKRACPSTSHALIEHVLGDVISVAELCATPKLYELYSRHQNCYQRLSPSTEKCRFKFKDDTQLVTARARRADADALQELCGQFQRLVQCVSINIEVNCGHEAALLIPRLLRPSVPMAQHCRNDTETTTSSTGNPPTTEGLERPRDPAYRLVTSRAHSETVSPLLLLLITFVVGGQNVL